MMNQFSTRITVSRSRLALFLATALLLNGCGQSGNLVLPQKTSQNSGDTGYFAPAEQTQQQAQ
ncbi:MAG: lipoprotein [Pseudomonadota bacterium]